MVYLPTKSQIADILTKNLGRSEFEKHRKGLEEADQSTQVRSGNEHLMKETNQKETQLCVNGSIQCVENLGEPFSLARRKRVLLLPDAIDQAVMNAQDSTTTSEGKSHVAKLQNIMNTEHVDGEDNRCGNQCEAEVEILKGKLAELKRHMLKTVEEAGEDEIKYAQLNKTGGLKQAKEGLKRFRRKCKRCSKNMAPTPLLTKTKRLLLTSQRRVRC